MGLLFTLRMLGDLSLYLCVACTIARMFGLSHLPMASLFILTACCGLCYVMRGARHPAVRLAPLALMLLCGFFVYDLVDFILLLPAAGFCAVTCHRQLFHEDKMTYRSRFLTFVKILAPLTAVALLMGLDTVEGYTLPFALLTLLTGVYLMQMLRQSEAVLRQKRFLLLNLITLLVALAFGLMLSSPAALAAFKALVGGVYSYLIAPLLMAVAYLFVALAWLIGPLLTWVFTGRQDTGEDRAEGLEDAYQSLNWDAPDFLTGQVIAQVLTALSVAALLLVAVLVLRRMLGRRHTPSRGATLERGVAEAAPVVPRIPLLRRTPRDQVRVAFRRFLLLYRGQGALITPDTTSQKAADEASGSFWCPGQAPLALRGLYIRARYSTHEVTRGEAQQAREHLAAIRRDARKNGV